MTFKQQDLKPNHQEQDLHIVRWQLILFSIALVFPFATLPFFHSDSASEAIGKIIDMLFVSGSILLAIKLAREGWDLAAAGYTILGIGWGILFAGIDFHSLDLDKEVQTSAAYFFLPSMLLIACYKPFPWWIKFLTISCIIPFLLALLTQKNVIGNHRQVGVCVGIGFNLFHVTSIFWGVFFYLHHRRLVLESQENANPL